jgi:hypothetical protein
MEDFASHTSPPVAYALSLKQPWAALLASGRKTIEVRRWPTGRRGLILIHAARIPDSRQEAWSLVPDELRPIGQLRGGIIGCGELTGCISYSDQDSFAADADRHLNPVSWFVSPSMYGFAFTNLQILHFRRYPGWMRFFPVGLDQPKRLRKCT